ncbi:hypothetical protein J7L48_08220, partial [bacterium]|nr:hypothetical protein [bacterium]
LFYGNKDISAKKIYFEKDKTLYKLDLKDFSLEEICKIKHITDRYWDIIIKGRNGNVYQLKNTMILVKINEQLIFKNKKIHEVTIGNTIYYSDGKNLYDENGHLLLSRKHHFPKQLLKFYKDDRYYIIRNNKLIEFPLKKSSRNGREYFSYYFYPVGSKYIVNYVGYDKVNVLDFDGNIVLTYNRDLGRLYYIDKTFYTINFDGKYFTIYKYENGKFNPYDKFRY